MASSCNVFRISMSSVPWTRPLGLSGMDCAPLDCPEEDGTVTLGCQEERFVGGNQAIPFVPRYDLAMTNEVKRIGLISDTHGLLRKEAVEALLGSELILHAGDVGQPELLEELRKIAPVVAVPGNVAAEPWANVLPVTAVTVANGVMLHMIHDVTA